jgi:hypothetical protein
MMDCGMSWLVPIPSHQSLQPTNRLQYKVLEQNFGIELPFLQAQTFKEQLQQTKAGQLQNASAALVYAYLSLITPLYEAEQWAFWHKSRYPLGAIEISERCAVTARSVLDSKACKIPSNESTQALLVLGFHEWRTGQHPRDLLTIGTAIGSAELLGCNDQGTPCNDVERNMYRCAYILDTYVTISSGCNTPYRIRSKDMTEFENNQAGETSMSGHDNRQRKVDQHRFCSSELIPGGALEDDKRHWNLMMLIKAVTVLRVLQERLDNGTQRYVVLHDPRRSQAKSCHSRRGEQGNFWDVEIWNDMKLLCLKPGSILSHLALRLPAARLCFSLANELADAAVKDGKNQSNQVLGHPLA